MTTKPVIIMPTTDQMQLNFELLRRVAQLEQKMSKMENDYNKVELKTSSKFVPDTISPAELFGSWEENPLESWSTFYNFLRFLEKEQQEEG